MRRAIIGVVLALTFAGAARASDFVVVNSTDPGIKRGTAFDGGARAPVAAGKTITVMRSTGEVTTLQGSANGVLLPGLFVRARLTKGVATSGMLIPQAAVTRDPKGQGMVLVVGAGNKAEPRPLVLGQMVGDKWLVTGGLKPGDRVIVEGLQKVQPGAPVIPSPVAAQR